MPYQCGIVVKNYKYIWDLKQSCFQKNISNISKVVKITFFTSQKLCMYLNIRLKFM